MQGIEITLKRNKQYVAENKEEYEIISGENNATTILVHFPEEYKDFSKRVDFKNIRNEKWSIGLYTPEDETKNYGEDFDKLNFAFTLPTAVTIKGELQIQFIAYLADNTETFVPFKLFKIIIEDSIMYVKKESSENPDLIIQAYEYANLSLELSRESLANSEDAQKRADDAEKSAINAEDSAKNAENSALAAQNSADSANIKAKNAENSALAAQNSAEYAEQVSNSANEKADRAVETSNTANSKSIDAVNTANVALSNSEDALEIANSADKKSNNAVQTSNNANEKSDNAVALASESKEIAQESNDIANFSNEKSNNAVMTANNANTSATNAVNAANIANDKSENAVSTAETANNKSSTALDIVENLTVSSSEIDCTEHVSVNIETNEITKRKNIHFNIPEPKQGKSYRAMGGWDASTEYLNNEYFIDTVSIFGCTYYCKKTNINQKPSDSAENDYWGLIALKGTDAGVTIVDNLESENSAYVLSAKQGKVLKELIDSSVQQAINNLTTTFNTQLNEATNERENLQTQINNMLNGTTKFTLVNASNINVE